MGLDDPYPLGEMESAQQSSYPGKILDLAIEREIITKQESEAIWEDNVIRWLCGDNEETRTKTFLPDSFVSGYKIMSMLGSQSSLMGKNLSIFAFNDINSAT